MNNIHLPLVLKRDVARNKADFENHFLCTKRKAPHAIWLNLNRLKEVSVEDRVEFFVELMHILGLDE